VPNTIDASTRPWIHTLGSIATNWAGYSFVPGHGDVGNAADVTAFGDYLATQRKLVGDAHVQGNSGAAVVQAVMPLLSAQYGKWDYFKYNAQSNILEMDVELTGKKRIPLPVTPPAAPPPDRLP
jgi:hypothetical protein